MSWGNKLILVFVAFAALMITLVYKSVNTKYELVSKEYYKDELRYQDKIDGKQNAAAIGKVKTWQADQSIIIQWPKEQHNQVIKGEAWFYCKTNARKDLKLSITVNEQGQFVIDRKLLKPDSYTLKLSWEADQKLFYDEIPVQVAL